MAYNELDYTAAVARVRAMQSKLMDNATIDKMLFASNLKDSIRCLADLGYNVKDDSTIEEIIDSEQVRVFDLMRSFNANEFLNILKVRFDYHNAKILLKAELTGVEGDNIAVDQGSIPFERLKEQLLDRNYRGLSVNMQQAIDAARDSYAKNTDVSLVDIILDSAMFKDMGKLYSKIEDKKALELLRVQIDIYNLKAFKRLQALNKPQSFYGYVIAEGGYIDPSFYIANARSADTQNLFAHTRYGKAMASDQPDKALDDYFMESVTATHMTAFGLSPIVGYYYEKENEMLNARIVLTCKKAGLKSEEIKKLVR